MYNIWIHRLFFEFAGERKEQANKGKEQANKRMKGESQGVKEGGREGGREEQTKKLRRLTK